MRALIGVALVLFALPACTANPAGQSSPPSPAVSHSPASTVSPTGAWALPSYDHIVVVIEENHSRAEVVGNPNAPYLASLANGGARMAQSFAITHPSQPNYLALFAGSTEGITDDSCPHTFSAPNLGQQLVAAGKTFKGYSESLPSMGYEGCVSGRYARKHSPWVNFSNVAPADSVPFTDFPTDFTRLPWLAFVVPNLCHDMHDCGVAVGDSWLKDNLGRYAAWAKTHNSLLIVTFDEDDRSASNQIPTLFYGAHVASGTYSERVNHYTVLRTLENLAGVRCLANACAVSGISDIWN